MKKYLLILVLFAVTGCAAGDWFFGSPTEDVDGSTPAAFLSDFLQGLGTAGVPLAGAVGIAVRMARKANRAKEGILDINKEAIENADWSKINSSKSFKKLLATAKETHPDFLLIKDEYYKWKDKQKS